MHPRILPGIPEDSPPHLPILSNIISAMEAKCVNPSDSWNHLPSQLHPIPTDGTAVNANKEEKNQPPSPHPLKQTHCHSSKDSSHLYKDRSYPIEGQGQGQGQGHPHNPFPPPPFYKDNNKEETQRHTHMDTGVLVGLLLFVSGCIVAPIFIPLFFFFFLYLHISCRRAANMRHSVQCEYLLLKRRLRRS